MPSMSNITPKTKRKKRSVKKKAQKVSLNNAKRKGDSLDPAFREWSDHLDTLPCWPDTPSPK